MKPAIYLIAAAAMLTACYDEEIDTGVADTGQDSALAAEGTGQKEGATVLGGVIPNAYTPEAMREALSALRAEGGNKSATVDDVDITATHLYLKFAPRDSADVALLDSDTTIMYTVIPMDREIEEIGDYYHDPDLPDSVPTFQYCVARVGQALPEVPHETLSELFLMEEANVFEPEDGDVEAVNKSAEASIWERLEAKALEMAGLDGEEEAANKSGKWSPRGEVLYYDNSAGKTMPLEGVPVRITRGFVTHQCCTDKRGRFSFSKRRHHARVYVKWRRDYFHIREIGHPVQQAESTLASHTKKGVSYTFKEGTDGWRYASVFRAAHQYYYNYSDYGLSRPKDKNLIIRLSGETPSGVLGDYNRGRILFFSDIRIYYKQAEFRESMALFKTTVHEIAHSAHHGWSKKVYRGLSPKMKESWARGVEWRMTTAFYNVSRTPLVLDKDYTPVVRDLIDDDESKKTGLSGKTYSESVSGIQMNDIERSLKNAKTWNKWRDNLVKLNPDKKEDIYEVFANWAD